MEDRLRIEIDGGVADVRLNRPEKLNAIDKPMFSALIEAGTALAGDASVRVVVLSGEGKGFCGGLDIMSLMGDLAEAKDLMARDSLSPANFVQQAAWVWRELPVPVIAAVHGAAFGAGMQVAMAADIRVVAPDARLSLREIQWGLIPDIAITQTFRNLVANDVARELTYTGREVSGEEALGLNLATYVDADPRARAVAIAGEIARRSPEAIRAAKRLWNEAPQCTPEEALKLESALQAALIMGTNHREAVAAAMARQEPEFSDPTDG